MSNRAHHANRCFHISYYTFDCRPKVKGIMEWAFNHRTRIFDKFSEIFWETRTFHSIERALQGAEGLNTAPAAAVPSECMCLLEW